MKRFFWITVVLVALTAPLIGQSDDEQVTLPDHVMKQVVSRMAKWYFKPRRKPTTIYFAGPLLKKEFFPEIRGVRFVLLDENDSRDVKKGYKIDVLQRSGRGYRIGFGYGEMGCGFGSGKMWNFRIVNSRVRLYPDGGGRGWGWGCASGGSPVQ